MSLQFNTEDQAVSGADLYSDPLMPDFIWPLAPVTLARLWSPIPMAVETLGAPILQSVSSGGEAVVIWRRRSADVAIDAGPPDISFFQRVLKALLTVEATEHDCLALVASVGWSYDAPRLGHAQRSLMKKHGYIETRRRP